MTVPNKPTLEAMKGALTRGLPINKPTELTLHDSKQWWYLAHIAKRQTGIDYTVDHTTGMTVLHPVR